MSRVRRVIAAMVLLGMLAVLPACGLSAGAGHDPKALEGQGWILTDTGKDASTADLGNAGITIAFDGAKAGGFAGVNTYGASYTAGDDGAIKFTQIGSTLMEGSATASAAEKTYLDLLGTCDGFKIADGTLTLTKGGVDQLVYRELKTVDLPGSAWTVTSFNNGLGAVQAPAEGAGFTIEFGKDQTVKGSAAGETYSGPCVIEGTAIMMGPFEVTLATGSPELATQQKAFLVALKSAVAWSVKDGQLQLHDTSGNLQVTAIQR